MPLSRLERTQRMALSRPALVAFQRDRWKLLLQLVLRENGFYQRKFASIVNLTTSSNFDLDCLGKLPFTTKAELMEGGDFSANLTWPTDRYVRFHRTSGTHGKPLAVLDTAEDWDWWCNSWQYVLDQAECERGDRAFMAFSFGPFIGFWSAFDAATRRGMLVAPGGGLSTAARIGLIHTFSPRVLFCTPSYALHLAESAKQQRLDPSELGVERLIVAGEPGGSVPELRQELEQVWGAIVIDHAGATEIGPWGFGDERGHGIYVNEAEFIAEVIDRETLEPVDEGGLGELVLTSLGRFGAPVIRYRTGDMVRPSWPVDGECRFMRLDRGVLGRADDMLIVRGVNVFPASVETILRSFESIDEYRMTAFKQNAMDCLKIEVEGEAVDTARISRAIEVGIGLRVELVAVEHGALPRSDGKAQRFIDRRKAGGSVL